MRYSAKHDAELLIVILLGIFAMGIALFFSVGEVNRQAHFLKKHKCKLIKVVDDSTDYKLGADGNFHLKFVDGQKCYLCDDNTEHCY